VGKTLTSFPMFPIDCIRLLAAGACQAARPSRGSPSRGLGAVVYACTRPGKHTKNYGKSPFLMVNPL